MHRFRSLTNIVDYGKIILVVLLFAISFESYSKSNACDDLTIENLKETYPLLLQCEKLTNSDGHSILVLLRVQNSGIFRLEVGDDLRSDLANSVLVAVRFNGKSYLRAVDPMWGVLELGPFAMALPKLRASADGIDIPFDIASETSGRNVFARALTELDEVEVVVVTKDRKTSRILFKVASSKLGFLSAMNLTDSYLSGALSNIESFAEIRYLAIKACATSVEEAVFSKCVQPLDRCIVNSQKDAISLKACLDELPK